MGFGRSVVQLANPITLRVRELAMCAPPTRAKYCDEKLDKLTKSQATSEVPMSYTPKKPHHYFTPEQKAEVVRRYMVDKTSIPNLCNEYNIEPDILHSWYNQVADSLTAVFERLPVGGFSRHQNIQGSWPANRSSGIARVSDRPALGKNELDPTTAWPVKAWHDLVADLNRTRIPPAIADIIGRYEEVGSRDPFLWKWCWRGVREITLPFVPIADREILGEIKLLAILLVVLLDDLADRPGRQNTLEIALNTIRWCNIPPLAPANERVMLQIVADVWQVLTAKVRELPDYSKHATLYAFDWEQVFNALRYSAMVCRRPELLNIRENSAYAHHNMAMMVFATIDIMSYGLAATDLAAVREVAWQAQKMGHLANIVATWRRELREGDTSSGIIVRAINTGLLDCVSLAQLPTEKVLSMIERSELEAQIISEWQQCRQRLHQLTRRIQSTDMSAFCKGVDFLLTMHQAARGLI